MNQILLSIYDCFNKISEICATVGQWCVEQYKCLLPIAGFVILLWITFILYSKSKDKKIESLSSANNLNFWAGVSAIGTVCYVILIIFLWLKTTAIEHFSKLEITTVGALIAFLFQDSLKGVMVYFKMWRKGMLRLGDWIEVPSKGVNGVIYDITPVNIIVSNWDNTKMSFPISMLVNEPFNNNQEMLDGDTSGRRIYRTFVLNNRSIRTLTNEEMGKLAEDVAKNSGDNFCITSAMNSGKDVLNITLFRGYILDWLRDHKNISHSPRLVVRLLEPTEEGIPMQVYAFINEPKLIDYEKVQSSITEHILLSMSWFGLSLYQRPSGEDVANIANRLKM